KRPIFAGDLLSPQDREGIEQRHVRSPIPAPGPTVTRSSAILTNRRATCGLTQGRNSSSAHCLTCASCEATTCSSMSDWGCCSVVNVSISNLKLFLFFLSMPTNNFASNRPWSAVRGSRVRPLDHWISTVGKQRCGIGEEEVL
ncbi:hypothetical protein J4Q44_G00156260, partial [Coregonus suidteri]